MLSIATVSGAYGYGSINVTPVDNNTVPDGSVIAFARYLMGTKPSGAPTSGGALTLNGANLENYEYAVRNGEVIRAGYSVADYFSDAEDTVSSWILFNGDVTFDSSLTNIAPFRPQTRKLFTVIYVKGDLAIQGCVSMTGRGAHHVGISPAAIAIGNGVYDQRSPTTAFVENPIVPANGGAGAEERTAMGGNVGAAGRNGGTGGGGGGYKFGSGGVVGPGSAGTCFSGGSGSGAVFITSGVGSSSAAGAYGGAGGDGVEEHSMNCPGGAGNPGGRGYRYGSPNEDGNGANGTGGVLIVICEGTLTVGTDPAVTHFAANGCDGGSMGDGFYGGGSGGGSVNIFSKSIKDALPTLSAGGGAGGGGSGTTRLLVLP